MSPAGGQMKQGELHIWSPDVSLEVDCPGHPLKPGFTGRRAQEKASWGGGQIKGRGGFFSCQHKMARERHLPRLFLA